MNPIFISVDSLALKIVPEVKVHMDGHPIIAYTYFLFKDVEAYGEISVAARLKNEQMNAANPNYFGFITFDVPGKIFTYTSNETNELQTEEIEQVIEQISYYRDHPELWKEQ